MHQPWQSVVAPPLLSPSELQIWRITLPSPQTDPEPYTSSLTPEEISRASRLRVGHVRLQFVVARACLRFLLGNLLHVEPREVPITLGAHGKPEIPGLYFNLAHSAGTVLIALSRVCEVGIDVESIDRKIEALDIARYSFSTNEVRELESVAGPRELQRAFFHCWTRKEAIIKADGRGLSLPLASFDVPVTAPASTAAIRVAGGPGNQVRTLYLSDLPCGEDLAAAVAAESPAVHLRRFDFPFDILPLLR